MSYQKRYGICTLSLNFSLFTQASVQEGLYYVRNIWNQVVMGQQNIIFQSPKSCILEFGVIWSWEMQENINVLLCIADEVLVHPDDCCLLDPLFVQRVLFIWFLLVCASAELSKSCDHKMPDLLILWIAWNQEHISSNALSQHSRSGDAIVAQSQKDPRDIGLNNHVLWVTLIASKCVEKIKNSFLNEYIDGLLAQSEVHQGKCAELLHFKILVLISA